MPDHVMVTLSKPVQVRGSDVSQAKVREPRFKDYHRLGNPFVLQYPGDGSVTVIDIDDVMSRYVEALCVEPTFATLDEQGSAADAMAVRTAVRNFFLTSGEASSDSSTSPNSSSSPSDGAPETSSA